MDSEVHIDIPSYKTVQNILTTAPDVSPSCLRLLHFAVQFRLDRAWCRGGLLLHCTAQADTSKPRQKILFSDKHDWESQQLDSMALVLHHLDQNTTGLDDETDFGATHAPSTKLQRGPGGRVRSGRTGEISSWRFTWVADMGVTMCRQASEGDARCDHALAGGIALHGLPATYVRVDNLCLLAFNVADLVWCACSQLLMIMCLCVACSVSPGHRCVDLCAGLDWLSGLLPCQDGLAALARCPAHAHRRRRQPHGLPLHDRHKQRGRRQIALRPPRPGIRHAFWCRSGCRFRRFSCRRLCSC